MSDEKGSSMREPLRLPLYVALVLVGVLAIVFKKDDPLGMIIGGLGVAIGAYAIYYWTQQRTAENLIGQNPSDQDPPASS
jgi:hypothetical protein